MAGLQPEDSICHLHPNAAGFFENVLSGKLSYAFACMHSPAEDLWPWKRKENNAPFNINAMRSQALHQAAQSCGHASCTDTLFQTPLVLHCAHALCVT